MLNISIQEQTLEEIVSSSRTNTPLYLEAFSEMVRGQFNVDEGVLLGKLAYRDALAALKHAFPMFNRYESSETLDNLHGAITKISSLGHSFPLWRHTAIPYNLASAPGAEPKSIFERLGLTLTRRENDKRPRASEDYLGSGYSKSASYDDFDSLGQKILNELGLKNTSIHIEYRRSYLMVAAEGLGTLVIRNSNPYFGRDNFTSGAYFTFDSLHKVEIENFSPTAVDCHPPRMQDVFNSNLEWDQDSSSKLLKLVDLFSSFDRKLFDKEPLTRSREEKGFSQNNFTAHLFDYLKQRLGNLKNSEPYPAIGVVKNGTPPWSPEFSLTVSPAVLDELRSVANGEAPTSLTVIEFLKRLKAPDMSIAMLSSLEGDVPMVGVGKASANAEQETLKNFLKEKAKNETEALLGEEATKYLQSGLIFPNFRKIHVEETIDKLSTWLANSITDAPGIVISLSGTDSILAFILCSKALQSLGKDPHQYLIGVHFRSDQKRKLFFPSQWLSQFGCVQVKAHPLCKGDHDFDIKRWEDIQTLAINHNSDNTKRPWHVGSRNLVEFTIGEHSQISNFIKIFPLAQLLKTEILNMCVHLGVQLKAINASLNQDPECTVACINSNRNITGKDYLVMNTLDPDEFPSNLIKNENALRLYRIQQEEGKYRAVGSIVPPSYHRAYSE